MKKNLFIVYIIIISIGAGYFGYHEYETIKADREFTKLNSSVSETGPNATDALISKYEDNLSKSPDNIKFLLQLSSAYIQKARETGDVSYFNKVDGLMDKAQSVDSNNAEIYGTRGIVALARHHFNDALSLGQHAVALNKDKALYYGIIADAQTELGQNDAVIETLQTMVDKRPDYSSFSRIAYARELHGDIDGAREAIQTAVDDGGSFAENEAWGYVELGKLDMRTNLVKAEQQFNLALSLVPNYTPALEQLGKVAFAKNDRLAAIDYFQKAVDILPLAQYSIDLGEVYARSGDDTKAQQQYALARIAFDKSASSGVNTDMEYSVFLSEHGLDAGKALQLADQSYNVRASIFGADALAWAYYKNNQPVKAKEFITQALRLGENDPVIVFHAAMIAEQNGDAASAKAYYQKALSLNPHFSILYAGIAESKLK